MVARGATGTDSELQAVGLPDDKLWRPQESAVPAPANRPRGRAGRGGRGPAGAEAAGAAPKDITAFSAFDMAAVREARRCFLPSAPRVMGRTQGAARA